MIHRLFISIRLVVTVCDFQPEKNKANLPDDVGTFDWIQTMYVRHKMRNESAASHHNLFNFCQPVIATWTTTVREIFRPIGLALRMVRTLRRQHGAIDETEIERKERKKINDKSCAGLMIIKQQPVAYLHYIPQDDCIIASLVRSFSFCF